jgi:TRAP-type C4-dicarboxylate transport system permease small subunit
MTLLVPAALLVLKNGRHVPQLYNNTRTLCAVAAAAAAAAAAAHTQGHAQGCHTAALLPAVLSQRWQRLKRSISMLGCALLLLLLVLLAGTACSSLAASRVSSS